MSCGLKPALRLCVLLGRVGWSAIIAAVTRRGSWLALGFLFFLSGAAGLVDQTAWTRLFEGVFGHTVHTTAAVLAAFMAGLGLGALVGGRVADRCPAPIRAYAVLEMGLAVVVWASPALARGLEGGEGGGGGPWRWLAAFALLLLPTTAMGATLPLLCRAVAGGASRVVPTLGWLLGANTLGAVAGTLAAAFFLIRSVGVSSSLGVGAALSLVAGVGALALSAAVREPLLRFAATSTTKAAAGEPPVAVALVVLGSGFVALAAEVVWVRVFALVLGSSLLSFALVLASLLAAYAVGSLAAPLVRRRLAGLGVVLVALGVAIAATVVPFRGAEGLGSSGAIAGLLSTFAGRAALAALVIAVPGLLMGAVLPLAGAAVRDDGRVGRDVGLLYLANTAGNVLGALGAGYVLIPLLGGAQSLAAVGALCVALGLAVLWTWSRARRPALVAATVASVVAAGSLWLLVAPGATRAVVSFSNPHARLVFLREGLRGTVTVFDVPPLPVVADRDDTRVIRPVAAGYRLLAVDGVDVAGTSPDLRTTQRMQAHVPLLLHGAPRRVLQVGFGSGETARETLLHDLAGLEVAELNPDVVAQSVRWFPGLQPKGFRVTYGDARIVVRSRRQRYDAILNDSTYPGLAGSSQLYSADHFRSCRDHLEEGGVVSTWLPVDLPPETFRMVLASFAAVFPEASFWLPANCWNKHGVLVGSLAPQGPLVERLRRREWAQAVRTSLAELGYDDADAFAAMQVLDPDDIRRLTAGVQVSDDDRPLLEYPARGVQVSGEAFWGETLRLILRSLGPPRRTTGGSGAGRLREAQRLVLSGQLALLEDDPEMALRFYRRAAEIAPEHPGPRQLMGDILVFRAQDALASGRPDEAQRLLAEADGLVPR